MNGDEFSSCTRNVCKHTRKQYWAQYEIRGPVRDKREVSTVSKVSVRISRQSSPFKRPIACVFSPSTLASLEFLQENAGLLHTASFHILCNSSLTNHSLWFDTTQRDKLKGQWRRQTKDYLRLEGRFHSNQKRYDPLWQPDASISNTFGCFTNLLCLHHQGIKCTACTAPNCSEWNVFPWKTLLLPYFSGLPKVGSSLKTYRQLKPLRDYF